jgi:transposase
MTNGSETKEKAAGPNPTSEASAYTLWLERLRAWQHASGKSVDRLAEELGVGSSALYRWLVAADRPSWAGARATESVTRVRAEVLFDELYL